MKTLLSLWILLGGSAFASPDVISARSRQLALAVDALHGGNAAAGMSLLLPLHEIDPGDDDVAYWMASMHYMAGRPQAALDLLEDRQGGGIPACRFRVLEARALVCDGKGSDALALLKPCLESPDPEQPLLLALAGVLFLDQGDVAEGVDLVRGSGGVPWAVLDEPLREALPQALNVRTLTVLEPVDARIQVVIEGGVWQVNLQTGLATRVVVESPSEGTLEGPSVEAQRTEMVPCGDGVVWSSPSEPLAGGGAGVFRTTRGDVVLVAKSPGKGVDDSPSCSGDDVWFVRRVGGVSALMSVRDGEDWAWSPSRGSLVSVDARLGDDGHTQLLLGWVLDGVMGVWTTPASPFEPVKLLEEEVLAPRWSP